MNWRTAAALLLPFLALGLQWSLWPWISPFVWFLFFPTVFFSARLGGLRGGLAATVISTAIVWYFFIPPRLSWGMDNPANLYSVGLFLVMGYLLSDVQERVARSQRAIEAALAEARTANEEVTRLYRKTLELDELKSRFFANVSHELRTPLTLILAPLERRLGRTAVGVGSDPQTREDEVILRNARLLYRHVTDLLDASRLDAGRASVLWAKVDLAQLARVTASHFESLAASRNISFPLELPPHLPAEADGEKVQRILLNLLSNAFKFTPDGGTVILRLRQDGAHAELEVEDNGPGVPAEFREVVFQRFRQVEGGDKRSFGGTGLGLAIVREFAELHGGAVRLSESESGGACFTLRLPLRAPDGSQVREAASLIDAVLPREAVEELRPASRRTFPDSIGSGLPRVLVVEDNPDLNAFIADALADRCRVVQAYDGREGLEAAAAESPDLILTDIMMPGMDGEELVQAVRRIPSLVDVPILVLTARLDETLRRRLLAEGVQDYLAKPFDVEELRARASRLLADRLQRVEHLRQSEMRFEATFEQAAVGMALVAPDGRWLRVNRKLCGIVGYEPEELLARTFQDITHPEDLGEDLDLLRRMLSREIETRALAKRYLRKDGSTVWVNLSVSLVWKPDGTPDYFIAVVEDIQARMSAEAALSDSEATYRSLFEHMLNGLAYCRMRYEDGLPADFQYLSVNEAFTTLTGLKDVTGRWVSDVIPGIRESDPGLFEIYGRVARGGPPERFETFVSALDMWFSISVFSSQNDFFVAVFDVITERKRAEAKLRKLSLAIEQSPESIVITDLEGRIEYVNKAFAQTSGYVLEEVLGQNPRFLKSGKTPPECYRAMWDVLVQGGTWTGEFINRRKDGSEYTERVIIAPLRQADGIATHYVAVKEDISEKVAMAADLDVHRQHLEELVAARTAELVTANRELDSFAYAVSHDLRAPLRAMSGFSQALLEDHRASLSAEAQGYLDQIKLASRRMSDLVDGILVLSRITRGEMRRVRVDLTALSRRILEQLAEGEPGRQVVGEVESGLDLLGDPRMVEALMENLLGNAWKYTARTAAAQIQVEAIGLNGQRWIRVQDNGAGFDMAHAHRLFQPFQRLHRQDEFPGIGIGLATVQRIVLRHGGRIEARGEAGKGAEFRFTLPEVSTENEVRP